MRNLNPITHVRAIHDILQLLTGHRQLTWEMTKKELTDRYAGQVFGTAWTVGHPIVMMLVYVFVFAVVFRARIGGTVDMPLDYTTYLLAGLIPWMAFQESMGKGTVAITQNASLVKQIIFPIEILPIKGVMASFITQFVASVFLIAYMLVKYQTVNWTCLLLPGLWFFQILAMSGISYIFAAVGVFFRDLKDFVQVGTFAGMYFMPLFYTPNMIPVRYQPLFCLNPFSYMIWCYQDAVYFGRFEHVWAWPVFAAISVGIFYVGYAVFYKLKHLFGDVL